MSKKRYEVIASLFDALLRCERNENWDSMELHEHWLLNEMNHTAPSGSGIDCGTEFDFNKSKSDKLIFHLSYHHMNDAGYYDGWTEHTITVTPAFIGGFDLRISGPNRNKIKDYLANVFITWLLEEVED